jgi:hypothetical protein
MLSGGRDSRQLLASPQVRMRELASGVDALYVSGRAALPGAFVDRLTDQRELAAGTGTAIPFDVGGAEFGLAGHGFGKYRFCLEHRHGRVGVSPSERLPALRIQPRSEFLHALGPLNAVSWFSDRLGSELGPIRLDVSRVDLHCDVQGWTLHGDDRHNFVCRGRARVTHEEDEEFTGLEFGRRTTRTICARIYDKTAHLGDDLGFWREVWGDRYDPTEPVIRVEFELGRQALTEYRISSPRSVIESAGALWLSVTEWLSYRTATNDGTKARWPLAPEWDFVRRATIANNELGIDRIYDSQREAELSRLVLGAAGYLSSIAACIGTATAEDTCERLPDLLRGLEGRTGRRFEDRIVEKRLQRAFR